MSVLNAKATLGPSSPLVQNMGGRQSSPSLNGTMAMNGNQQQPTGMHHMQLQMPSQGRYPMAVEGPPVTQPSSISVTSQSANHQEKNNNSTRNAIAAMIGVFIGATVLGGALWWKP